MTAGTLDRRPLHVAANRPPALAVIVDTEERFDWRAPLSRESVDVSPILEVGRLQQVLARHGVVPTYVIDYPVAASETARQALGDYAAKGACLIGAHLHPWVNPPYAEPLEPAMSYGCNLPPSLEADKIQRLVEAIVDGFGSAPRIFKAGRYGFGPATARTLEALDFDVDTSVNPRMNFSADGGPSFEAFDAMPFVFGAGRRLLELPCTTGFTGVARRFGTALHRAASSSWLRGVRAVGLLARSGILNKVMLSPEGSTLEEMRLLTDALYDDGVRTFALTFHSPSLSPGCTPYVRTERDRDRLLATIDAYCEYFRGDRGGVASTPLDLYQALCQVN